jgi:hypothetical protein
MEDLKKLEDGQLLLLRASVDAEMRRRNLGFSVGEIGEQLAIEYFNSQKKLPKLQRSPRGSKNVDALSRDGNRYSIKTIQRAKKTGTVYPNTARPDDQLFEYLLLVVIDDLYGLRSIYRIAWESFVELRAWDKRMSAWYFPVTQTRLQKAELIYPKLPV